MTDCIHCEIVNVKPLQVRQVTAITLEIPIEHFAAAAQWFGKNVLITPAPDTMKDAPFGVLEA